MNLKNIFAAIVLAAILAVSCKKDDDSETTYQYFSGNISFTMPEYVRPGDSFTFNINEISTLSSDILTEGESIRFYVTDPYTARNDTLEAGETVKFTVRDTLGTFTLTIKGYCSGFVNSSCSATFSTINPSIIGGSMSGTGILAGDSHFTDSRDGNTYFYTRIGDLLWIRHNLAYAGTGIAYRESEVMNTLFGRFYTFDQAQTACPDGWRIPTDAEWQALYESYSENAGALMADVNFNGTALWGYWKDVHPTNESKLALIPAGYASVSHDGISFNTADAYAALWTSTEENGMGVYRYIHEKSNTLFKQVQAHDSFYLPVRCVKKNN